MPSSSSSGAPPPGALEAASWRAWCTRMNCTTLSERSHRLDRLGATRPTTLTSPLTMALVASCTQELTLAWTPLATRESADSMKRSAGSGSADARSSVKKETKKRRRESTDVAVKEENAQLNDQELKQQQREEERRSHSDAPSDSNDEHKGENSGDAGNYGDDDQQWPSLTRKRQRMTEDERKARHREVQRQFMQRKLAKLEEMRKLVVLLEKQFMLLQLSQERARLEHENDYLHRRVLANPPHWTHEHPEQQRQRMAIAQSMGVRPPPPTHLFTNPHQHNSTQSQRPPTGMLPWDEILEAVSEANV